ncbi:MAG TPA: S41 family peptidase [Puia sp.]|nr:S41 family peptidase [Puia sp.]
MILKSTLLLLLLPAVLSSSAQMTAMQAYDVAQDYRHRADPLYDRPNPPRADLETGIRMLDSAIRFLDSTPIQELAYGNIYLKARRHDVYLDLAQAYTIGHQPDSALYCLDQAYKVGRYPDIPDLLLGDSSFSPLWPNPRFKRFIAKYRHENSLWADSSLSTPYQANLPYEEKVAGLSLLWSMAKYNFVHFDLVDIDWDKTYLDYLSQLKTTTDTKSYYRLLTRFYAQLQDGHTNVYPPDAIRKDFYSRPPIRSALIEGRVFVTEVWSDSLRHTGIVPGLEILQIDGQPVIDYAEKNVAPYESSSTPQDMRVREFNYALLAGPDQPVNLTCKEPNGRTWTRAVARSGYTDVKRSPSVEFRRIGTIGYLTLNDFGDNKVPKIVDSLFPQIETTSALIIDIRKNGGGSSNNGLAVLAMLTDKPFSVSLAKQRKYISRPGEETEWENFDPETMNPSKKHHYAKPVALLIGPQTFSAAEDCAVAFDAMHRGPLIGVATGGSTGQPILFKLPGGGTARVCAKHDSYPDGKEFIGVGIQPTVKVEPTIRDVQTGTDATLQKALELLK